MTRNLLLSCWAAVVFTTTCATYAYSEDSLNATHLRCEYLVNPVGLDTLKPRLSWRVESSQRGQKQTAYQIVVSDSLESLQSDEPKHWDSGKVDTSDTLHIEYAGQALKSGRKYFWKVRSWDRDAKPSAWSEPASWSMGLLSEEDCKPTTLPIATSHRFIPT